MLHNPYKAILLVEANLSCLQRSQSYVIQSTSHQMNKGGCCMKNAVPEDVLREIFQKRLKRRNLNDETYLKLKKMILTGKLKNGRRLVQEEISHSFDVSRTVVRYALLQLRRDKLIVTKYKRGAFVSHDG